MGARKREADTTDELFSKLFGFISHTQLGKHPWRTFGKGTSFRAKLER